MNKRGFTLVELIAVIVILGIVITVMIPAASSLLSSSSDTKYQTYVETIEKAVIAYAEIETKASGSYLVKIQALINKNYLSEIDDINKETEIKFEKAENGKISFISPVSDGNLSLTIKGRTCTKNKCE